MQIISAQPLIDKFRNRSFEDSEVGPYFIAYMVLMSIAWIFTVQELDFWSVASGVASVVITVFGVLHLKERNGGSFGDQFLARFFSLGWVISVRLFFLAIPACVMLFALASIVGGKEAFDPAGAIFSITFEIIFYRWLGLLFDQSKAAVG